MNIPPFPHVWDVFHDGSIDSVSGELPGTLELIIRIEYLRERFDHPGDAFRLRLLDCTEFVQRTYQSDEIESGLEKISANCPGILSGEMRGDLCICYCDDNSTLEMKAAGLEIFLDDGVQIPLSLLIDESSRYWEEFSNRP